MGVRTRLRVTKSFPWAWGYYHHPRLIFDNHTRTWVHISKMYHPHILAYNCLDIDFPNLQQKQNMHWKYRELIIVWIRFNLNISISWLKVMVCLHSHDMITISSCCWCFSGAPPPPPPSIAPKANRLTFAPIGSEITHYIILYRLIWS